MYSSKKCPICNENFTPRSSRQIYCKKIIKLTCLVCGETYDGLCQPTNPTTCNRIECKKRAGYVGQQKALSKRVCTICGTEFQPVTANQVTCNRQITKTCVMCGKEFSDICAPWHNGRTCSAKCKDVLATQGTRNYWLNTTKKCLWCGKEFHPTSNSQNYCPGPHFKKCTVCGKEFEIDVTNQDQRLYTTCSKECRTVISSNIFKDPEVRAKQRQTCLEKYGVEYPAQNKGIQQKQSETMLQRYGVTAPYYLPSFKNKAVRNARDSQLEIRICQLLDNYKIAYKRHHIVSDNQHSHEFDFVLEDYKLLIDADGVYFHSYLSDPDGGKVRDDYDEIRLALIPEGYRFYLIVEGNEDRQVREIVELLESIGADFSQYDSFLFDWCRSIDFPYPEYTDKRLQGDWASLSKYVNDVYIPQCRIGESVIKQFHKSIYHCHVGTCLSPYEGWYDDTKLKKVIRNRLIYRNDVDPSKILAGFNISKIAPCVTIFNPVLTKHLITKYLHEFNSIFDPFSGFSGRLLGAACLGVKYIGQDLNEVAVSESNQIIDYLQLDRSKYIVSQQDVLKSTGKYSCLLTCPPYSKKETYSLETVFKTCDEWIDECLNRFECRRYVFVIDSTSKYQDNIAETISNSSHFSKSEEYVVVIDNS